MSAPARGQGQNQPFSVVVDINVYLHAMTPGHRFHQASQTTLMTLLVDPKYRIATSEHILDNIYDKLQTQLGYPEPQAADITADLEEILIEQTEVLDPEPDNLTDFIADREDNNILALAAESDSRLIVSNDLRDLASLGSWRAIPILPTPKFNEYARTGYIRPRPDPASPASQRIAEVLSRRPEPRAVAQQSELQA